MSEPIENFVWEWGSKVIIALAPFLIWFGGKRLVDRARSRKLNADAQHTTASTSISMTQMSEQMATRYMDLFNAADEELRKSRQHWQKAEFLIREILYCWKTGDTSRIEDFEKRADQMFSGT